MNIRLFILLLSFRARLCLLFLPKIPLVALDFHLDVLTDSRWHRLDPIGRALSDSSEGTAVGAAASCSAACT